MKRSLLAMIVVAVLVIGGGAYVTLRLVTDHVDNAVPQASLFGESPSPGGATGTGSPPAGPRPGADIKGPLNILIVGIDTRESIPGWTPHSDAIMIMHVTADLRMAYLTSIPRDLVLDIPAFPKAAFHGAHTKITNAMAYGSRVPGKPAADPAQGFELVAKTISAYTGIKRFDAGALVTFTGLKSIVDAIGGIDLYIDEKVVSIHMRPDGKHRAPCAGCAHGYSGPQMTYNVGQQHLVGWQALDLARQRYLPGNDYDRQRHQRQIIRAMIGKILSGTDLLTDPQALDRLLRALPGKVIFDGRGRKPVEFAFALAHLRPQTLVLVGLPGSAVYSGGSYLGEQLAGVQSSYFAALRADRIADWVKSHPTLINKSQ